MSVQLIWDIATAIKPETRKPGEFLSRLRPEMRAKVIEAVNRKLEPAPWVLRILCHDPTPKTRPRRAMVA